MFYIFLYGAKTKTYIKQPFTIKQVGGYQDSRDLVHSLNIHLAH